MKIAIVKIFPNTLETEAYWSDFGKGQIFGPFEDVCYDVWPGRCEHFAKAASCNPKWKVLYKHCKKSCGHCSEEALTLGNIGKLGNKIWLQIPERAQSDASDEYDDVQGEYPESPIFFG